jgi:hypothetical protein
MKKNNIGKEAFKDAKVGDKVWDFIYGWGEIKKMNSIARQGFPMEVLFICDEDSEFYTYGGKEITEYNQTLFWDEFEIPKEAYIKPLPKLETDTEVIVWSPPRYKAHKRHFSHFTRKGKMACFTNGLTSWTSDKDHTTIWDNWELADD